MTDTTRATDNATSAAHEVDLAIEGMTCASCVSRIERKVGKLDGVDSVVVNLATEKARVRFHDPVDEAKVIETIVNAGYAATPVAGRGAASGGTAARGSAPAGSSARGSSAPTGSSASAAAARGSGSGSGTRGATTSGSAAGAARSGEDAAPTGGAGTDETTTTGTDGSASDSLEATGLLATLKANRDAQLAGEAMPRTSSPLELRMKVAIALAIPVFVLGMIIPTWGPSRWIQLVLATPAVLWCALPFHRTAWTNAKHLSSTMDTLVSLSVVAAYLLSIGLLLFTQEHHVHFEVATTVTTFLLIGRVLEARAKDSGRDALRRLLDLGAKQVAVLRIDPQTKATSERLIDIADLQVGQQFIVRPGEKVATDGIVLDGRSSIDASLVTGESVPVPVDVGDEVIGGSVNTDGRLVVEARRVGSDTLLAGIQRLVEQAQTGKAPVQRLADRISAVFVPAVLALAVLTFIGWVIATQEPMKALVAAITVLVVACPCALGLATPTALLVGTGRGAELGTLIKGPEILEDTRRVDTVLLDKTGTVTDGSLSLKKIAVVGKLSKRAALVAAAAVEQGSEHPIGRALVAAADYAKLPLPPITDFAAAPGEGAMARIKGTEVTVGQAALFEHVPDELLEHARTTTGTTVYAGWGDEARAAFTLSDTVRPTSKEAIDRLAGMGLTAYLLTGDNEATAQLVADEVGIPAKRVIAEVKPAQKHEVVERLQREGRVVAMVGDGVNDAPALARADLGVAMGSGTDVAMDSADVVLVRPDLGSVADGIGLSRATLTTIKQNLAWAFGYNLVTIPLAVLGRLNPAVAGALMALSSVLVVLNSLRLKRWQA